MTGIPKENCPNCGALVPANQTLLIATSVMGISFPLPMLGGGFGPFQYTVEILYDCEACDSQWSGSQQLPLVHLPSRHARDLMWFPPSSHVVRVNGPLDIAEEENE